MVYRKSTITDKLYRFENDTYIEVPRVGTDALYIEFVNWLSQNNTVETFEGTEEEIVEKEEQSALINETEMYKKRTQDGINAYAEISAEFRLAKLSGVISKEQHGAIEETLIPVRNEILAGQWISAKQKLETISVAIGSDLYNRLHTQISNYIAENYDL